MVEQFFLVTDTTAHPKLSPQNNISPPITLLSGPPSSGKTSLAFQFGINAAASNPDRYVVFLCKRSNLLKAPPYLSQGVNSSSPIFNRVQIKYHFSISLSFHFALLDSIVLLVPLSISTLNVVIDSPIRYVDDEQGLKRYFAAFHLLASFPVAVIVDDFAHLFDDRICQERYDNVRGREMTMVRLLSLCQDAIAHANKTAPCELLLTETHHGDSPQLLFIYKRWISSMFLVKGDGCGSFFLQNTLHPKADSLSASKMAKYSIALQYLLLDGIFQPS
ncbi:hypothetical protein V2J09_004178 [Rumex salicifolius]